MSEAQEEMLKELDDALSRSAQDILDSSIRKHGMDASMRLDPERRDALEKRLERDLEFLRSAVQAKGYVLALMRVNQMSEMCHNAYKLPDGHRSGEIDGMAQWLSPVLAILDTVVEGG